MANKPMSKAQIISHFVKKFGLAKKTAAAFLDEYTALAISETKKTGNIILPGIGTVLPKGDGGVDDTEDKEEKELWQESLSSLRARAISSSAPTRNPSERRSLARFRSKVIKIYVLKRANGLCEGCNKDAPFKTNLGRPYLEPHHINQLSGGGPDHPQCVIALCPNCHREGHYGANKDELNHRFSVTVKGKEEKISILPDFKLF